MRNFRVFLFAFAILQSNLAGDVIAQQTANEQPANDAATIRDFGAIGDGVADDTAAIQRAVDSQIGSIRFPKGKYRITQSIVVNLDTVGPTSLIGDGTPRVIMEGAGPAIRLVGTHEGTAAPQTVKDNVWDNQRTPMIDGIEIVGAHEEACGIEADGTMQLTVTRVVVRKSLHGIHLVNRNRNVVISDCHLYENRGVGLFYDNVSLHQSNIVGCHISYNEQGGVVIRGGDVRNVHIGTCDIEGNMGGKDSQPTANVLMISGDGSFGEVAIVGCTIQHAHDAPDSANIRIDAKSNPQKFTSERRHGNITIANNVLSDVQHNIDIKNARGVTITGNTIWQGYTSNVRVANSRSIVMSDNVFDRNPRYFYGDGSSAKLAITFNDCDGGTISGNHIDGVGDGEAALVIKNSRHFNITSCTILDCGLDGILLDQVSRSRVSDCLIDHRDDVDEEFASIREISCDGNQISDNLVGR